MRGRLLHGIVSSIPNRRRPHRMTATVQVLMNFDFTVSVFDVSRVA